MFAQHSKSKRIKLGTIKNDKIVQKSVIGPHIIILSSFDPDAKNLPINKLNHLYNRRMNM